MTEGASESKGVLERIASVKAEFEVAPASWHGYSTKQSQFELLKHSNPRISTPSHL